MSNNPSTKSTEIIAIHTGTLTKIKRARFNLETCSPACEYGDVLWELIFSHPNPQKVIDELIEGHPEDFSRYNVGIEEEQKTKQPAD